MIQASPEKSPGMPFLTLWEITSLCSLIMSKECRKKYVFWNKKGLSLRDYYGMIGEETFGINIVQEKIK